MKCQVCGNDVPNDSTYCHYCGKKIEIITKPTKKGYFISPIAVVLVSVFLVALVGLNIWQFYCLSSTNNQLAKVSEKLKIAQNDKDAVSKQYRILYSDYNDLEHDLFFYERYVVFADTKSNYYHVSPDCLFFDSSSFYAYNTDNAIAMGYRKCPYCS